MADNVNKYSREEANNANSITQSARSLTEELKDQLGVRSRLNETQKETLNLARSLQRSAQENTVEIGNAGNIERQIAKDIKIRLGITRELKDLTQGANKASATSLENATKITKLTKEIQRLEKLRIGQTGTIAARIDNLIARKEAELFTGKLSRDTDAQRIALLHGMVDVSDTLIDQRKQEAETQKDINDKMGVTGALVKGTGALMERLGMRSGIFQDAMKESAEAMREMAEDTVRGTAKFSKLQIMAKGFSKIASGFGKALFDPFTLIAAMVSKFFELNAASTKLQQLTGQNAGFQAAHNQSLASGAQIMGLMAEMTERTGVAAQAMFSSEDLGRLAEAQNLLGLSAEQASNLGMFSKVSGTSIQGYKEDLVESVNNFNAMNDSAVAHGVVMKDVLNASADVAMSLNGNPGRIAKAAAAARKLGLDLAKVNQIADGLMDFETSIGNELEAQLLTGKNINLSKARELALNNDLEGVANELAKNGASAAEFANMNRIQQEAIAKAMGMNREEMGRMLINQKGMNNLSAEQRAKMRGVTLEQLEQMEAAESLKLAFSKIAEPLASILNTLSPILTMLAKALSFVAPFAPYILLGVKAFQMLNSGILGSLTNMKKLLKNTSLFGKLYKGGQFMPGGGRAAAGGQRAGGLMQKIFKGTGDKTKELVEKTKGADGKKGKGIKGFLKGLGDGLASIGRQIKDVVKGALALGIAGVVLGGSFALALQMVKDVDPAQMLAFAGSLSMLGLTLALLGLVGGQIIQGALAMGILGIALIPAAYGFSLLKDIDPGQMFAFAGALTVLGLAAAGLGFLFPFIAAGAGAIALLGAALIPVAYGFAALGNTPIESMIGKLSGIASMAPQLLLVGGALMSIAAGLGAIAIAGIAAIPALAALSTFAIVVTPLAIAAGGLFGGDGGEDNSMAEISAKLDKLISVVSKGGDVYLDGNKVGDALVLGSYKSS